MKQAAVLGTPVAQSLSPAMHHKWLAALGLEGCYLALETEPHLLEPRVQILAEEGFVGVNITAPLKEIAADIAEEPDELVTACGAANLLIFKRGRIEAYNTDAQAIADEATTAGWQGGPVLIIGAGGVARAAVHGLLRAGASNITVANRRPERAQAWAEPLAGQGVRVARQAVVTSETQLIINATPADPDVHWPNNHLQMDHHRAVAMDLRYDPLRTPFLQQAEDKGVATVDGLRVLIAQGRPSFQALFDAEPPEGDIYPDLAALLSAEEAL